MKKLLPIALFTGLALLVTGCGGAPTKEADTPEQALKNMQLAIEAGDKKALMDCFEVSSKQKAVLEAFLESLIAVGKFGQAMTKAYGEEAAIKAMRGVDKSKEFSAGNWAEEVEIKIDGDTATASRKRESQGLRLVRREGVWKIDGKSMFGVDEDTIEKVSEMMIKAIEATTRATKQTMEKIGQPGYTAEKIVEELEKAIMEANRKTLSWKAL